VADRNPLAAVAHGHSLAEAIVDGSVPSHDSAVELQDLRFQGPQLGAEACNLRHALVTRIRDDIKQLFNTIASHRGYDSERQMGANRIDHRGLLADEEMAPCRV
jgi:hypothetical protein